MPVGEVVFVLDWASECQCDWGPDVSGHLQLSLESLIESGKPAHDVVIHLEAVKRRADEVAELLGLEHAPDDLLAYEVMTTIVHESIHCAIADALTPGEGVENLLIARLWRGVLRGARRGGSIPLVDFRSIRQSTSPLPCQSKDGWKRESSNRAN